MKTAEQLIAELKSAVADVIVIPNSWLPPHFRNERDGGRTAAELHRMVDKIEQSESESHHATIKRKKAENVRKYQLQNLARNEIRYDGHQNENQLYKNEQAFLEAMIQSGVITDEFLDA